MATPPQKPARYGPAAPAAGGDALSLDASDDSVAGTGPPAPADPMADLLAGATPLSRYEDSLPAARAVAPAGAPPRRAVRGAGPGPSAEAGATVRDEPAAGRRVLDSAAVEAAAPSAGLIPGAAAPPGTADEAPAVGLVPSGATVGAGAARVFPALARAAAAVVAGLAVLVWVGWVLGVAGMRGLLNPAGGVARRDESDDRGRSAALRRGAVAAGAGTARPGGAGAARRWRPSRPSRGRCGSSGWCRGWTSAWTAGFSTARWGRAEWPRRGAGLAAGGGGAGADGLAARGRVAVDDLRPTAPAGAGPGGGGGGPAGPGRVRLRRAGA